MIPFVPEALEDIKARVPQALAFLFDIDAIEAGTQTRPGLLRGNVLDFEDGMRMILSREDHKEDGIKVHVSFSWASGTPVLSRIEERLRTVVGYTGPGAVKFVLTEGKQVPHCWLDAEQVSNVPHPKPWDDNYSGSGRFV